MLMLPAIPPRDRLVAESATELIKSFERLCAARIIKTLSP